MLEKIRSLRWKAFGFALLFAVPLFTGSVIALTNTWSGAATLNPFGVLLFLVSLMASFYFFLMPWVLLLKPLNEVRAYFGLTDSRSQQ